MMCQLQKLNLWVLKGIVTQGGEKCPGLFLYIKVEDYSDWIASKTRRTSLPLSSFSHRVDLVPFSSYSSNAAMTQEQPPELDQVAQSKPHFQEQRRATTRSGPANSSRGSLDSRKKSLNGSSRAPEVAEPPTYYDYYYSGEFGSISGQDRSHQPQGMTLFFPVLASFAMVDGLGADPPN